MNGLVICFDYGKWYTGGGPGVFFFCVCLPLMPVPISPSTLPSSLPAPTGLPCSCPIGPATVTFLPKCPPCRLPSHASQMSRTPLLSEVVIGDISHFNSCPTRTRKNLKLAKLMDGFGVAVQLLKMAMPNFHTVHSCLLGTGIHPVLILRVLRCKQAPNCGRRWN